MQRTREGGEANASTQALPAGFSSTGLRILVNEFCMRLQLIQFSEENLHTKLTRAGVFSIFCFVSQGLQISHSTAVATVYRYSLLSQHFVRLIKNFDIMGAVQL